MDKILQKALYIVLISLGLAFIFNFLFFQKQIGISLVIFIAILLGATFLYGQVNQLSLKKIWWLVLPIIFFSLMLGIRANEFLSFLNVCATFGLLLLFAHEIAGTSAFLMKIRDYFVLAVIVPFKMLARAGSTLSLVTQIHSRVKNREVFLRILKGVIMAVPILIIFGVLFSQADLVFSQFVRGFIHINISERSVQYLILLLFAFIASLSFLSYIFFKSASDLPSEALAKDGPKSSPAQPGRGLEVMVFLGLISLLFLMFIVFQITYLFGGQTSIVNAGFTYAEYARRGFWELLAVAIRSTRAAPFDTNPSSAL